MSQGKVSTRTLLYRYCAEIRYPATVDTINYGSTDTKANERLVLHKLFQTRGLQIQDIDGNWASWDDKSAKKHCVATVSFKNGPVVSYFLLRKGNERIIVSKWSEDIRGKRKLGMTILKIIPFCSLFSLLDDGFSHEWSYDVPHEAFLSSDFQPVDKPGPRASYDVLVS